MHRPIRYTKTLLGVSRFVLASIVTLSVVVAAPPQALARGLFVRAQVPIVVPVGLSEESAIGFTPALSWRVDEALSLEVVSGMLYRRHDGANRLNVPVLAGIALELAPEATLNPTLTAKLGYTYAPQGDESRHWITGLLGAGALVKLSAQIELDVGIEIIATDLKGRADDPVAVLFKLGIRYRLL